MKKLPRGLRYMIEAAFYFSVMSVLVKYTGRTVPVEQLVFARSIVALVLSFAMLRRDAVDPWGNNKVLLVTRGLLGLVGLCCFYYAVTKLPLGDVTVIQYTNPIFVALLAALFLGERAGVKGYVLAAIAATFGVVLIAQPTFLFGGESTTDHFAAGIAFIAALTSSAAYVIVRKLAATDHPVVVVFWFPLVATPILLPFALMTNYMPTLMEFGLLIAIGCATQAAQVRMTQGLHLESAARATSMTYLQIVFAFTWGVLLFDEIPSALTVVGALIVVSMVVLVSQRRHETVDEEPAAT